jgi:hypothetical protein
VRFYMKNLPLALTGKARKATIYIALHNIPKANKVRPYLALKVK